jgi:hypothetical protein
VTRCVIGIRVKGHREESGTGMDHRCHASGEAIIDKGFCTHAQGLDDIKLDPLTAAGRRWYMYLVMGGCDYLTLLR